MFRQEDDYKTEWNMEPNNEPDAHLQDQPGGLFNLGFIRQHDPYHTYRSGWHYVHEYLIPYHNKHANLLLDLNVDRSFHWKHDELKHTNIIPYRKPWIGFIHHTFNSTFSLYNCKQLFNNIDFIESLKECKGLFVLSHYMYEQIIEYMVYHNIRGIPVHSLVHPLDTPTKLFNYQDWKKNANKQLIHIGGWLQDTFRFYRLELAKKIPIYSGKWWDLRTTYDSISKSAITDTARSNYFPPRQLDLQLYDMLASLETHSNDVCNTWNIQFYNEIYDNIHSVKLIEHLDSTQYDTLLCQNIVCVNVIDASVVYPLMDCIIRHTPIIINRHPAVVEVLGKKYPLYIDYDIPFIQFNRQVNRLLSDSKRIYNAHVYLRKLDKTKFKIQTFVNTFLQSVLDSHHK